MDSSRDYPSELVKVNQLIDYLKNRGWGEVPFARKQLLKFKSPYPIDEEDIYAFIPSSERLIDYKQIIEGSIETISLFEDKAFEDVLSSLLIFSDRVKSRIIEAKNGMIFLDRGIILYKGLRDLITSSASSLLDPSTKNPSRTAKAKKFASSSLIGQSEYGSYVANIYIPLDKPNKDFDFTRVPFQRKVVLRILKGMQFLNESIDEESAEPIIRNYKEGLNLDMCGALVDIIDAGKGNNVVINAILEPAYKPPSDILTEFTLTPRCKYYLEDAIETLKEEQEPEKREGQWVGFPRLLDRPERARRGLVKLEVADPVEGHIDIFIKLNESDYQFCAEANKERRSVQISGILEKDGKKWMLNDPSNLMYAGDKLRNVIHPKQSSLKNFDYTKTG